MSASEPLLRQGNGLSRALTPVRPAPAPQPPAPSDIIGIAAHELRQPASVIYGLACTLKQMRGELTAELLDELVVRLHRQAERLVGVLDDTLDLNRINGASARVELVAVELSTVVDRALSAAAPPAGVHVSVAIVPGTDVIAEAPGLERLLVNLLVNAYHYGGPNIRVDGRPGPGGVQLTVADDGPGVPDTIVPHLFEPFWGERRGHGLGLAIVLGLAESFGGSVSYQSGHPSGAEFVVTLLGAREPHPDAGGGGAPSSAGPATVLIVDDEADIRWLLRVALEAAGYRVVEAAHGREALDAIRDQPPAVLLSDLMMPVMDGNELARRVRATPGQSGLPILVLSANPDGCTDADRVLRKPCDIGEVTRAVAELIRVGRR